MRFGQKQYDVLSKYLNEQYGFAAITKQSSWFMWVIAVLLYPFNRKFMTDYTTTIAGRVYFPKGYVEEDPGDAAMTLAHEGRHLHDAKWHGQAWFMASYLFPICLLLISWVGFLFLPWWLALPVFLAPLAPWPAPGRVKWERAGYTMTAVVDILDDQQVDDPTYLSWMASHFCGWGYYKMMWSSDSAMALAKEIVADARTLLAGKPDLYGQATIALLKASNT